VKADPTLTNQIRRHGFTVENVTERTADGRVLSHYYLRHDPERDGVQP
jgi:hypothetical protein